MEPEVVPPQKQPSSDDASDVFYNNLISHGSLTPLDGGVVTPKEDVLWLDRRLIAVGQKFVRENLSLYMRTFLVSLIVQPLAVKPVLSVIFLKEKPTGLYLLGILRKVKTVMQFFALMLQQPEEQMQKMFYKTKKIHQLAVKKQKDVDPDVILGGIGTLGHLEKTRLIELVEAMNRDMKTVAQSHDDPLPGVNLHLGWNSPVPFSNFTLVYFSCAFVLPVWLEPELYGIRGGRNDIQMKGLIHCWALIIKLLGVHDEYNLFIQPNCGDLIDRIARDVYVPSLQNLDVYSAYATKICVERMWRPPLFLTHGVILALTLKWYGHPVEGGNLWRKLNLLEKLSFKFLRGLDVLSSKFSWVRKLSNILYDRLFQILCNQVLGK